MRDFFIKLPTVFWVIGFVFFVPVAVVWLIGGLLIAFLFGLISYLFDSELRANIKKPLSKGMLSKRPKKKEEVLSLRE